MNSSNDTITKIQVDLQFPSREEALHYLNRLNEKPRHRESFRMLLPFIKIGKAIELKILVHQLINGYENDLYRALINYAMHQVEPDFHDSRVMRILFNKAKKLIDN